MKKIFGMILFLFVLLFFPIAVFAQTSSHQLVVLPKTQTVNHDYFGAGQSVDLEGTVNGDAYLAGGTILMNGTVNGDILAAGGQITINGTAHNLRVTGGQVVVDGKVNGNVTVAGGSVTITSGSAIAGSVVGAGGQILLFGPVGKTVNIAAGQVTVGNTVGGNMSAATGHLLLNSGAKLGGSLWYQSQQNAQIDKGATIAGKVTHTYPPQRKPQPASVAALVGINIITALAMLIVEIVIGLLLLSLVPVYSQRVVTFIPQHFWLSLGIGILAWIVTPFVFFILLLTLIGIPLAIFFLFVIFVFSYIGRIYAAVFFGRWLLGFFNKRRVNIFASLIIGLIVVEILSFVPFLGGLFSLLLTAIGFGAVLILEKNYYTELRTKKII